MNDLVKEWIAKSEADFITALREYRARKNPNYDAAGFHAQQCIEKYLKAVLQLHEIPFQKIHDLLALMELCSPVFSEITMYKKSLAYLNQFAVLFRYPGETADKGMAKKTIAMTSELRHKIRNYLKLDN